MKLFVTVEMLRGKIFEVVVYEDECSAAKAESIWFDSHGIESEDDPALGTLANHGNLFSVHECENSKVCVGVGMPKCD